MIGAIVVLVGLLWAVPSWATCSGSGLTWSCTSGSTAGQVQTAVDSASNEAVITFAAGTYSFSGVDFGSKNGITLICATGATCTMTSGSTVFGAQGFTGTKTNLMRVSGFTFTGVGSGRIWVYGPTGAVMQKLRLDHNTFRNIGSGNNAMQLGDASAQFASIGAVIDNNICRTTISQNFFCLHATGGDHGTWLTGMMGTATHPSVYFEDNWCDFNDFENVGAGCIDTYHNLHIVARFNTVTNSVLREHSYCHYGPSAMEVYGNDIRIPTSSGGSSGYRNVHFQGSGELIAFENIVDPVNAFSHFSIEFQHFRASPGAGGEGACTNQCNGLVTGGTGTPASPIDGNRSPTVTYRGYPCWHQPGRDQNATLKPMYYFKNRRANNSVDSQIVGRESDDFLPQHLVVNRDYYIGASMTAQTSPTSPFNGTTGVGHGTLANRPTTCTPTSEALDAGNGGVGYWATDQGSWNTSTSNPRGVQMNGSDGVLYRCSATNTWTVAYTPYTYPHPLQAGGADTLAPAAPTNLRFAQKEVDR